MNYTELHLHDHFSTLDGKDTPEDYMKRARELGMTHLSQTNHGTLSGHRAFQRAAKEAGIIPILGVEAYISGTDRFDRRSKAKRTDGTNVYNHLIILAQNETGLQTLNTLNEKAWVEGFYNKPRIDLELLEEHNEGLIVTSGCMSGLIPRAIEAGDMDLAVRLAQQFKRILPGRFYIEIQGHNDPSLNEGLLKIADGMNIPAVVTSDCHYARKEDLWVEEAMLILSTNPKTNFDADFKKSQKMDMLERFNYLYPDRTMTFEQIEIYLKSAQEHRDQLKLQGIDREDLITNTWEIAKSIGEYPYHEGLDLLPKPKNSDPDSLLEKKVRAGLKKRGLDKKPEYIARLEEELEVIKSKNFSTYFLIVANMVEWAKSQDILVGPGRGSGVGSLVNYCLEITDVDPIEYGLLFFRFINPERNDFPDIDIDFQDSRRHEVKDYLRRKFKHVASIATFATFKDKSVVRDAARVFRVPLNDVNKALKGVDAPANMDFMTLWKESDQGKDFIKKYPEVIKLAKELDGHNRSMGMHASGIVVAKEPVNQYGPIETSKDPNDPAAPRVAVLAMDMREAEQVGLIKLDVLGLKALTILDDTMKSVKKIHGRNLKLKDIPLNDKGVFAMINEGYTKGVFQAEGHTFTQWILENGVYEFNDLVIGTSIARPGPLNTVGKIFKARRLGKEQVSYVHEIMEKYTRETLGCIIYQEQVMQAMTDLGGMTGSKADKVRKIIGKKLDVSEFKPYMDEFVEGATKHISQAAAESLWHDFEKHAGYSFNKSHAVAYSMITYWTAWFKHHYPQEFMCAVLSREKDKDSRTDYLIEAKRLGIKVLLPHVNASEAGFSVEGEAIRFGLSNIKYVANAASKLILYRPYENYRALLEKVEEKGSGLTTRHLGALNKIGAAAFPDNPRTGNERDNFYEYLQIPAFETKQLPPRVKLQFRPLEEYEDKGCFVILAMVRDIKRGQGWARIEVLDETGTAGIFHTEHTPLEKGQMYAMLVADNRIARYAPMEELEPTSRNTFVQFLWKSTFPDLTENFYHVVSFQSRQTKAGKNMATMVICDEEKNMQSVLIFPQQFNKAYTKCKEGSTVLVELKVTDDGAVFLENVS
jgi:DNA polymerase-3 subunit alpha